VNAERMMYSFGRTALQAASAGGRLENFRLLLKQGANYNAKVRIHGRTALHAVSDSSHLNVVCLLLKKKPISISIAEYKVIELFRDNGRWIFIIYGASCFYDLPSTPSLPYAITFIFQPTMAVQVNLMRPLYHIASANSDFPKLVEKLTDICASSFRPLILALYLSGGSYD